MNTSINDLVKKLPDYEDFMELAEAIEKASSRKSLLEINLKTMETNIVRTVTSDPQYFQGGKVPSMSFIESTWKYTGLENELIPHRLELAEVTASLEKLKIKMDIFKTMLDIWRTLSANSRKAEL